MVCAMDLGPTRTDFNLGTPRFEIPSHCLTNYHKLCDSQITNTINMMKLPSKQTTSTFFHNFGVVHKLPDSLVKSFRVVNKLQLKHSPKHASK